jgi:hypothetical protein
MAKVSDIDFANLAAVTCTESAANTLTFKKLDTQVSINQKVAWLINRLELFSVIDSSQMGANLDSLSWALTRSNLVTDLLDLTEAAIVFQGIFQLNYFGAAASGWIWEMPRRFDFSTLPGGGILVPASPLYLGIKGNSLTGAATLKMRIYYQVLDLSPEQFWQLVETTRVVGS